METTDITLLRKSSAASGWSDSCFHVYWEGLVFINGILSGEESIKVFTQKIHEVGIEEAAKYLKGIFFISVKEKKTGDIYAFVDNSGLYQAFYTKEAISSSFLKLADYGKYRVKDLNPDAIVEFLYFGTLFFNKSLFEPIKRIPGDKILRLLRGDQNVTMLSKQVSHISEPLENGTEFFYSAFESLAKSLKNRTVSIDLTGGFDSRLIALMLDHFGMDFETAISAGDDRYEDVVISEKVANSIRHPWFSTIQSIESLDQEIPELFLATEGQYNILYFHRLFQLQKARSERGVDTIISGVGGELFKDVWWLQDFPFYYSRHSNLERLVDLRIMCLKPVHQMLTERYSLRSGMLRKNLIQGLSHYMLPRNTETYDNIFFNFKMREEAGRELTNYNSYVKAYAPFLDLDMARAGFMLPRAKRIYNMYHRKELTRINPAVAKMPTTEGGISASSDMMMIMRDLPKYLGEKMDRLLTKLKVRKQKRRSYLTHPRLYQHVRSLNIMEDSITSLKDAGIINKDVETCKLEDGHLGMLLSLGMLVKRLQQRNEA